MATADSEKLNALRSDAQADRWRVRLAAALILVAGVVAYVNTFSAPFIFDDIPAIAENPTIRDFARPGELLAPPALRGSSAAGRPIVNLSLALNRALGGDDVRGYHAFNLAVHLAAALALFGLVRRTLAHVNRSGAAAGRRELDPTATACAIALLWVVHPLLTESVTCIIQRTESLMGLFYLLTLYCFARSAEGRSTDGTGFSRHGRGWGIMAVAACALGAATKEVAATAPVLVLLYDRTFLAGSFRAAWRARWRWHAALAATWIVVALLIWRSETRGGTVGFGRGVAWWEYALTQCRAIVLYLRLALWPHPLVLDYGTDVVRDPFAVLPQALLLAVLLAATFWALVRRPRLGFLGASFFVVLAPSSSVVPIVTQTMAEHRMYLPLAAVIAGAVLALRACGARAAWPIVAAAGVALAGATLARNRDYGTADAIWHDTVAKRPGNARAHFALAQIADAAGRRDEAIAEGEIALRLQPDDPVAHFNLAFDLDRAGRFEEAAARYREAARLRPDAAAAHVNLVGVLVELGRLDEAIAEAETVVRMQPASGEDQFNLGRLLALAGRFTEALPHAEAAVRLMPKVAESHYRLGHVLVRLGRTEDAAAAFREATRLAPDHFEAHMNLAGALMVLGRPAEAVPVYETALRLKPDDPLARTNLALALRQAGR
ncbi:MAG TPA: tetratricopeptide repeat protein [Opitutaceae bacterium]|nr:tetratricopeptide repeat protein [Opitutaceae bacterium]